MKIFFDTNVYVVDYLVTNDRHLLDLNPYESLRVISMTEYHGILVSEGLIPPAS